MTRKKAPKKKTEIVFDPQKRKEFLTGFRKRKNERRKRAQQELERNLKEERKRIRLEIKDGIKHMKKSYEPLKEITEADKVNEDEYEDDDVKVKIVELSTGDLAAQRCMLGQNQAEDTDESVDEGEEDDEEDNSNRIPGMDFDINAKRKRKYSDNEENNTDTGKKKPKMDKPNLDLKTKKELDHFKKVKTLKKIKKSKVFKMKEQLDKKANQKKARKDKNNSLKSIPAHMRKKKKFQKNPYNKGRLMNRKQLRRKNNS
ncbi:nucleolar protein viriato [Haematobia irritans]|uniref:nucleolar protein viriato n=1 Tax=Haematobia irritans TaxID=7368 RepID=UPI003F504FB8